MLTLRIEGGPCDGQAITLPVIEDGQPAGMLELGGAIQVLHMSGAEPHEHADWHYCHLAPQPSP
ncbi:hypothetical protein [Streptomyces sp. N35]|uniref:hypothetical protein n=1 Tax=Streptomyces sp. N35 TaxID=2795730 RepID=UPI0018F35801|nr:hypothetical protein [Streptomyces sp. N35]